MPEKIKHSHHGINILKFIAVVLVVLIHESFPGKPGLVTEGIAAMSVPVFFMIAGYYSYGAEWEQMKRRTFKIFRLVILANLIYFIWDIIVEFLAGGSVAVWLKENCTLKKLLVFLLTNESPLRGHLWFLGALLYSYLFMLIFMGIVKKGRGSIAELIRKNNIKYLMMVSVLLLVLNIAGGELLTFFGKNIQIPYIRNWLFMGLPFFCLAYCIHAYEKNIYDSVNLYTLWRLLAAVIILNIAEVWIMPQSGLYITTIFVNIITFLIVLGYPETGSGILIKLGNLADKYGLWVYILQIIVIKNFRWIYEKNGIADMAWIQYLSPFFVLMISFIISVIPVYLLNKADRIHRKG